MNINGKTEALVEMLTELASRFKNEVHQNQILTIRANHSGDTKNGQIGLGRIWKTKMSHGKYESTAVHKMQSI